MKKRAIGFILIFSVLLGSSTIYASGVPEASFSKWYGHAFKKESEIFKEVTTSSLKEIGREVNNFLQETQENVTSSITFFVKEEMDKTNSRITQQEKSIQEELQATVVDLENANFDNYPDEQKMKEEINAEVEVILEDLLNEL